MTHIIACVVNDLTYDQRMIRCCTTLAEAGYRVTLVGRKLPDSKPLIEQPFEQHRLRCKYNKGPQFYAEFNYRLFRYLSGEKHDIVLSCDLDTALAATRSAIRAGVPAVHDAHEWFTEVPELQGRELVRGTWKRIGKKTMPLFKACYTVGPRLAIELQKQYGREFGVVRNVPVGLDLPCVVSKNAILSFCTRGL